MISGRWSNEFQPSSTRDIESISGWLIPQKYFSIYCQRIYSTSTTILYSRRITTIASSTSSSNTRTNHSLTQSINHGNVHVKRSRSKRRLWPWSHNSCASPRTTENWRGWDENGRREEGIWWWWNDGWWRDDGREEEEEMLDLWLWFGGWVMDDNECTIWAVSVLFGWYWFWQERYEGLRLQSLGDEEWIEWTSCTTLWILFVAAVRICEETQAYINSILLFFVFYTIIPSE